jgi:predicted kinase
MAQKIYIMVGFPGSGKSTWAKEMAKDPETVIICKDVIRHMFKGEYLFDASYEPLVAEIAQAAFNNALMAGFNVIIDETHITKDSRARCFAKINEHPLPINPEIICVWFTEEENNLEHRMRQPRGYTDLKWTEVIDMMKKKFEKPSKKEGFTEIIKVPFGSIILPLDEV